MLICRLILALWLILSYDLWEDRCVSDVTLMNNFWWKICCDRLKNRTGRFACCCKLSSVKKCKKITASLILLKRGLEFKTKLKKRRSKKSWKKTWKKQPNIAYSNLHTAKFLSLFPSVLLPLKWNARGPESAKWEHGWVFKLITGN